MHARTTAERSGCGARCLDMMIARCHSRLACVRRERNRCRARAIVAIAPPVQILLSSARSNKTEVRRELASLERLNVLSSFCDRHDTQRTARPAPRPRAGLTLSLSLRSSGRTEIGNAIAGTEYDVARNREFAFWRQTWIRGLGMHRCSLGSLAELLIGNTCHVDTRLRQI